MPTRCENKANKNFFTTINKECIQIDKIRLKISKSIININDFQNILQSGSLVMNIQEIESIERLDRETS